MIKVSHGAVLLFAFHLLQKKVNLSSTTREEMWLTDAAASKYTRVSIWSMLRLNDYPSFTPASRQASLSALSTRRLLFNPSPGPKFGGDRVSPESS
jgi:hypothetical protein